MYSNGNTFDVCMMRYCKLYKKKYVILRDYDLQLINFFAIFPSHSKLKFCHPSGLPKHAPAILEGLRSAHGSEAAAHIDVSF